MKKLTIRKETIRNLDNDNLREIHGGKYKTSLTGKTKLSTDCSMCCDPA